MAAPDIEVVEITLLSGRSDRPSMTFNPGTPSPTVSLGSAGQWAIAGDGVGPVHVFVTFDGQSVHVAAAVASLQVSLAGNPIGTGWTKAPIPCELRFGGACVILRRTSRPGAFAQEEATVHDGGALWHAAQRASQQPPQQQAPGIGAAIPSVRPAAGMPAGQLPVIAPQQQYSSSHPPAPMDLGATTPLADAQKFRDAVMAAQAGARPPADSSPSTVRQPIFGAPEPLGLGQEPLGELEKTVVAPHPPGMPPQAGPMGGPMMGGMGGIGTQPPMQPMAPPATLDAGAAAEKKPNYWQAASPVKKATLVLMPFALMMAFLMLHDEAPPPPHVATGASSASTKHPAPDGGALAANATTDAGDAIDGALAASANANDALAANGDGGSASGSLEAKQDKDTPATKVTPLTGSKRTSERAALDSVAAGSFDDAAKRYDALAGAHADDPSYKEAARILHEKAGN